MAATKSGARKKVTGFTDEEKRAMRQRVKELQTDSKLDPNEELQAKLAEMQPKDRALGRRIDRIIKAAAPSLEPKLWYGMPAYAKGGKNVCFFQPAAKFKTRYATLGFNDPAHLDDGHVWPVAYAVTELTPADEAKIAALVKKAAS